MAVSIASFALNDVISGTSDAAVDTLYFANQVSGQINACTVYNAHTSPVEVSFYILTFGGDATAVEPVAVQTITNGTSAVITGLLGHVIPKNGGLFAFAGTTAVLSVTASGIAVS